MFGHHIVFSTVFLHALGLRPQLVCWWSHIITTIFHIAITTGCIFVSCPSSVRTSFPLWSQRERSNDIACVIFTYACSKQMHLGVLEMLKYSKQLPRKQPTVDGFWYQNTAPILFQYRICLGAKLLTASSQAKESSSRRYSNLLLLIRAARSKRTLKEQSIPEKWNNRLWSWWWLHCSTKSNFPPSANEQTFCAENRASTAHVRSTI